MAQYIQFDGAHQASLLVEVQPDEVTALPGVVKAGLGDKVERTVVQAQALFTGALGNAVHQAAEALIDSMEGLPASINQVEMTFGLKVTGEVGNMAIAKAGGEVNFTVKLMWERQEKSNEQHGV